MTYKQALEAGYKRADQKYQRGYVSRKTNIENQNVFTAGGSRKNQKYILLPCYSSTQYCIRQYLAK